MALRSHIDTWTFCKFIHVPHEMIDDRILQKVPGHQDKQALAEAFFLQYPKSERLLFHETYHVWQGIRLPYLHLYAAMMVRETFQTFREFSCTDIPFVEWDGSTTIFLSRDLMEKVDFHIINYDLIFHDTTLPIHLKGAEINRDESRSFNVSLMDLLENSTSLAEFQFDCANSADVYDELIFNRWAKRHAMYKDVFEMVAWYFDNDVNLALRLFIPMVNASFHTTNPLRAFALLICVIKAKFHDSTSFVKRFFEQPEPCKWSDFFQHFLNVLPYDDGNPENNFFNHPNKFSLLKIENTIIQYEIDKPEGKDKLDIHPILTPLLRKWLELETPNPGLATILDAPGLNRNAYESIWRKLDTLTIMKFEIPHEPLLLTFFSNDQVRDLMNMPAIEYVLAQSGIMRKVFNINFDQDNHFCRHAECPYYSLNYCNSYMRIPNHYTDCEFPGDVQNWIELSKEYERSKSKT